MTVTPLPAVTEEGCGEEGGWEGTMGPIPHRSSKEGEPRWGGGAAAAGEEVGLEAEASGLRTLS